MNRRISNLRNSWWTTD